MIMVLMIEDDDSDDDDVDIDDYDGRKVFWTLNQVKLAWRLNTLLCRFA